MSTNCECIVSRLPIQEGEPCRIFPIHATLKGAAMLDIGNGVRAVGQLPLRDTACADWRPLTISFKATFSGDGAFEVDPDERAVVALALESLIERFPFSSFRNDAFAAPALAGLLKRGDVAGAWRTFNEAVECRVLCLEIDGLGRHFQPVAIAAMHESAYKELLDHAGDLEQRFSPDAIAGAVAEGVMADAKSDPELPPMAGFAVSDAISAAWYPGTRPTLDPTRRILKKIIVASFGEIDQTKFLKTTLPPVFHDAAVVSALTHLGIDLKPSNPLNPSHADAQKRIMANLVHLVGKAKLFREIDQSYLRDSAGRTF